MKIEMNMPDKIFNIDKGLLFLFLNPLLLISAFLISLNMVIMPRINDIGDINQKISKTNNDKKQVEAKINYLKSIDKNELLKDAQLMDSSVLKDRNSYVLVKLIRKIADKVGFQIKSFSISPGKLNNADAGKVNNSLTAKLPVVISLVGPQGKSVDFLLLLEKSLPILTIENFDTKTNNGITELDLTVSSFYFGERQKANLLGLSLADLTLRKDEMDLIKELGQFERVDNGTENQSSEQTGKEFTKYSRENPFSL